MKAHYLNEEDCDDAYKHLHTTAVQTSLINKRANNDPLDHLPADAAAKAL